MVHIDTKDYYVKDLIESKDSMYLFTSSDAVDYEILSVMIDPFAPIHKTTYRLVKQNKPEDREFVSVKNIRLLQVPMAQYDKEYFYLKVRENINTGTYLLHQAYFFDRVLPMLIANSGQLTIHDKSVIYSTYADIVHSNEILRNHEENTAMAYYRFLSNPNRETIDLQLCKEYTDYIDNTSKDLKLPTVTTLDAETISTALYRILLKGGTHSYYQNVATLCQKIFRFSANKAILPIYKNGEVYIFGLTNDNTVKVVAKYSLKEYITKLLEVDTMSI